jgi:hypothetical protein
MVHRQTPEIVQGFSQARKLAGLSPEMSIMRSMLVDARFIGTPVHSTSPVQEPPNFCSVSQVPQGQQRGSTAVSCILEHGVVASIRASVRLVGIVGQVDLSTRRSWCHITTVYS